MATIPASAQVLIDRLAAVDQAHPVIDQARVEAALAEHFGRLNLPPMPVRWVTDAEMGYRIIYEKASAAGSAAWSAAWSAARSAAWSAARSAARSAAWSAAESADWNAARSADWNAAWSAAWSAAESAAESAAWSAAGSAAWSAAWSAAGSAAWSAAWSAARSADWNAARSADWNAAWSAAESAAESAAWSAAGSAAESAIHRWIGIWLPFVDAFEAGLWLFWVTVDEIVAVPRPAIRINAHRLDCADGPAVHWPGGAAYYFVRGVQVPAKVVQRPYDLTVAEIRGERNAEVRRVMIEAYTPARFLLDAGATMIHQDETGALYHAELPGDEPLVMVQVVNATPERDGAAKTYWLRVPPTMTRARQAVAWTFDVPESDYQPTVET